MKLVASTRNGVFIVDADTDRVSPVWESWGCVPGYVYYGITWSRTHVYIGATSIDSPKTHKILSINVWGDLVGEYHADTA